MGILTYDLEDGDLRQFTASNNEYFHLIKISEEKYAIDSASYGEFKKKSDFDRAKKVLEKCVESFENIEVKSDNELSLYLSTEVLINQVSMTNDQEHQEIDKACLMLSEAFDQSKSFFNLIES